MTETNGNLSSKKFTCRLTSDTAKMLEEIHLIADVPTKNNAVNEAIKFYYGYLTGSISQDYLCGTLGVKLEAIQNRGNDRIARLLYKLTTELNLNTKMIAADKQIPKDEYDRMRRKAMQEINGTRGIINLYDAGLDESIEKEGS